MPFSCLGWISTPGPGPYNAQHQPVLALRPCGLTIRQPTWKTGTGTICAGGKRVPELSPKAPTVFDVPITFDTCGNRTQSHCIPAASSCAAAGKLITSLPDPPATRAPSCWRPILFSYRYLWLYLVWPCSVPRSGPPGFRSMHRHQN